MFNLFKKKEVAVPFKIGDNVYYQGFKLVVTEIVDTHVIAVTPGDNNVIEPTQFMDDYRMFVKIA